MADLFGTLSNVAKVTATPVAAAGRLVGIGRPAAHILAQTPQVQSVTEQPGMIHQLFTHPLRDPVGSAMTAALLGTGLGGAAGGAVLGGKSLLEVRAFNQAAKQIAREMGVPQRSLGDMLKEAMSNRVVSGNPPPSTLSNQLFDQQLAHAGMDWRGFIDASPPAQRSMVEAMLRQMQQPGGLSAKRAADLNEQMVRGYNPGFGFDFTRIGASPESLLGQTPGTSGDPNMIAQGGLVDAYRRALMISLRRPPYN